MDWGTPKAHCALGDADFAYINWRVDGALLDSSQYGF